MKFSKLCCELLWILHIFLPVLSWLRQQTQAYARCFFFFPSVLQSLIIFSTQNILCYSCLLSLQQLSTSYLHTNMWFRGFIRLDIDVMTAIVLCYSLLIIWRCLMQQKCCVVLGGITLVAFMIKMHSTC